MNCQRYTARANRASRSSWLASRLRRVLTFCVLASASCWLVARVARAQLAEAALMAGEALAHFHPTEAVTHRLRLNGEVLHLHIETLEAPLTVVLDQAEARCRVGALGSDRRGAVTTEPRSKSGTPAGGEVPKGWPLLRYQTPRGGVVACLAPPSFGEIDGQIARLRRFGETGDLAALGRFVYVYAQSLSHGRTHRLVVYNPGHFRTRSLLPPAGQDAAGEDLEGVSRPHGAVRLLSASLEGAEHAVVIYRVSRPAAPTLEEAATQLRLQRWQELALPPRVRHEARAFERRGMDLIVAAAHVEGGTALTVVRSPSHSTEVREDSGKRTWQVTR